MYSGLAEVKLGVAYRIPSGKNLRSFPSDLSILEHVEVEYETLEGRKEDITNVRPYNELPAAALRYVERIEELIGLPCQYIGVGFIVEGYQLSDL